MLEFSSSRPAAILQHPLSHFILPSLVKESNSLRRPTHPFCCKDSSHEPSLRRRMISESKSSPRLTLYRGWDSPGNYVWSPFVTKVEARFRFAGLSYRSEAGSLSKAPRGKIPYVAIARGEGDTQDPDSTSLYSDSTLIIDQLVEDGLLDDLNAKLSPVQKAHDAGLRALLEDKLYFYQVCIFERMLL